MDRQKPAAKICCHFLTKGSCPQVEAIKEMEVYISPRNF